MLVSIERRPRANETVIRQVHPGDVWLELRGRKAGDGTAAMSWGEVYGYPAPCVGIDVPAWPLDDGLPVEPRLDVWWAPDDAPALELKRGKQWKKVRDLASDWDVAGDEVTIDGADRRGADGAGAARRARAALVRGGAGDAPAGPAGVGAAGRACRALAGREHRFYDAGRYVGLFWYATLDTKELLEQAADEELTAVELVSVPALKKEAEAREYRANFGDLDAPAAVPGRPAPDRLTGTGADERASGGGVSHRRQRTRNRKRRRSGKGSTPLHGGPCRATRCALPVALGCPRDARADAASDLRSAGARAPRAAARAAAARRAGRLRRPALRRAALPAPAVGLPLRPACASAPYRDPSLRPPAWRTRTSRASPPSELFRSADAPPAATDFASVMRHLTRCRPGREGLVVYLAGLARLGRDGRVLLLPSDADADDPATWLPLAHVLEALRQRAGRGGCCSSSTSKRRRIRRGADRRHRRGASRPNSTR